MRSDEQTEFHIASLERIPSTEHPTSTLGLAFRRRRVSSTITSAIAVRQRTHAQAWRYRPLGSRAVLNTNKLLVNTKLVVRSFKCWSGGIGRRFTGLRSQRPVQAARVATMGGESPNQKRINEPRGLTPLIMRIGEVPVTMQGANPCLQQRIPHRVLPQSPPYPTDGECMYWLLVPPKTNTMYKYKSHREEVIAWK